MMKVHTFPDAATFLDHVQEVLEADEIGNSVMLGVCLRMAKHPQRVKRAPYLAVVTGEDGPLLAAMMTPPHNLVLATPGEGAQRGLTLLIDHLLTGKWTVPGVLGHSELARTFAEAWQEATGTECRLEMRQRLHALREVRLDNAATPGRLRPALAADLDTVAQWFHAFWVEALGEERDSEAREAAQQRITDGHVFLWQDQGRPVSMAIRTRPTRHTISISGVYTPPHLRRCGYATACVAELSRRLLAEGYSYCTLYTDLANPTSNHIYYEIGYRPVSDFEQYSFGP